MANMQNQANHLTAYGASEIALGWSYRASKQNERTTKSLTRLIYIPKIDLARC